MGVTAGHQNGPSLLQDTRRMHAVEIEHVVNDIMTQERMEQHEKQRALAQSSGWAKLQYLQEQLLQCETRLAQLKHQLYFPDVKGYK